MKKIQNCKKRKSLTGFTLVEMLVAVGLFTLVASFALGAVLTIVDANKKAQSSKTLMDNLNYALENMTRTMRFGHTYHCSSDGNSKDPRNCSDGASFIAFSLRDEVLGKDVSVIYEWDSARKTIMRTYNNKTDDEGITSTDTKIDYARFYVFDSEPADHEQPHVLVVLHGYSGTRPTTQTAFSMQTLISQRGLDI